jgi:hypothetical protein
MYGFQVRRHYCFVELHFCELVKHDNAYFHGYMEPNC